MAPKYAERMARAGDLLKMRSVDVPDLGKLGEAFRIELRRAYRAGQGSVREEIDRMAAQPELGQAVVEGDFETTRDGIVVESPEEVTVLQEGESSAQGLFGFAVARREPAKLRCSFTRTGKPTGLQYLMSLSDDPRLLLAPPKKARKVKAGKPDAPGESVADEIDPESAIENIARTSALAAGDRVKTASITAVQSAAIGGVLPAEAIAQTVAGAVTSLSPGADLVAGQRDTNTIFGLGRMQEARA
jgi:hypothetical protein